MCEVAGIGAYSDSFSLNIRGILLSLADFRALRLSFNMEAVACPPSVPAVLYTGTHIVGCPRKRTFASYR